MSTLHKEYKDATNHCCEYANCEKEGTTFDESLDAWLCKEHEDTPTNSSGFCTRDCQLGFGCDGSC